jgi:predicted nucleic acid-binding protein
MGSTPPPDPPRIFLDASVLFAAALSATGSARDLVLAGSRGSAELIVSSLVMYEVERNLVHKAPRAISDFQWFRSSEILSEVDPTAGLIAEIAAHVEPKDAPIVAGAIVASAAFLASYDRRHLLSQAAVIFRLCHLKVDTPDAVLRALGGNQ